MNPIIYCHAAYPTAQAAISGDNHLRLCMTCVIESEVEMKRFVLSLTVAGLAVNALVLAQGGDPRYGKPKRLNKMMNKGRAFTKRQMPY